jgi:hypothetical protein
MATLDFVYDIVEKLNDENIDYLIIAVQHNSQDSKADILYNMSDERTPQCVSETLDRFHDEVISKYNNDDDDFDADDSDTPESA